MIPWIQRWAVVCLIAMILVGWSPGESLSNSKKPNVAKVEQKPNQDKSVFICKDEFGVGATIPMAWADADKDGNLDLTVGNFPTDESNELYLNLDGSFTPRNEFGIGFTFAVAWADFDNDGNPDLAVGNAGQNLLFINNGQGGFVPQDQFGAEERTIAVAWGDADNDGDVDLAVGNGILGIPQQNYLYINNANGTFSAQPQFGMGQTDSVAWADHDNDGDLDLAVGNGGFGWVEQNYLYVNNGDGSFTAQEQFGTGDTAVVAWADANNDGLLDLAVGNWGDDGQNYLYINQGKGTFVEQATFGARDTNTLAWGDFDLDGDLDLAVGNGDFEGADQNYLYINDGNAVFSEQAQFGHGSTDSVIWGDYDNDGDLDLAVGNEHSPTQNQLCTNETNGSSFLQIRLIGQFAVHGPGFSNRDAIGAKIAVFVAGHHVGDKAYLRGFQQVEAKGGFSSQNAIEKTFGLPLDDRVDLEIIWPGSNGRSIIQHVWSVRLGQHLTVVETLLGDLNGDGKVDFVDMLILLHIWGPCEDCGYCLADLDGNCSVDFHDFIILLLSYHKEKQSASTSLILR